MRYKVLQVLLLIPHSDDCVEEFPAELRHLHFGWFFLILLLVQQGKTCFIVMQGGRQAGRCNVARRADSQSRCLLPPQ